MRYLSVGLVLAGGLLLAIEAGAQAAPPAGEKTDQVTALNAFVVNVLEAHTRRVEATDTRKEERLGGYARLPDFYREITHYDAETDRLLGRVQWETGRENAIHSIELYFYDPQGRVKVDYLATYLTDFRNAPIQALINIHHHADGLSAFRQFDVFGDRLFERCQGTFRGEAVNVSLSEEELPPSPEDISDDVYGACFDALPASSAGYENPLVVLDAKQAGVETAARVAAVGGDAYADLARQVAGLDRDIAADPDNVDLLVARGEARFLLRDFNGAIKDFTRALERDEHMDRAYFGRGMARARAGDLDGGIADLTLFLDANPKSSLGYTKRGVRYIWKGDLQNAERDLRTAIALDPANAEAHDDLGVVLAQTKRYDEAAQHFERSRTIEPNYQKAHHNLAMVHYIGGHYMRALDTVEVAVGLDPGARDSLMLKALILEALGHVEEAEAIRARAEFLPEGNWSERSGLR